MYDPSASSGTERSSGGNRIPEIIGIPFSRGNRVELLESGQVTFRRILDCISSARDIICAEFYIFKDDTTGKKIAEILKDRSRQGVKVYLLYDHFGSFLTSGRFWKDLRDAGIGIAASHPFRWSSPRRYIYRDHKKLLIVDGKKAFTGGFNIADEYHGYFLKRKDRGIWRDTAIYLEGEIASVLLEIFKKSWSIWKRQKITYHAGTSIRETGGVPVIPIFAHSGKARRRMRRLFIHSINSAKKEICLTTAYFMPGRRILRSLEWAARRGVRLRLLLPGRSDVRSIYYAGRSYYRRLLNAGVQIYAYQGSVLHSKTAVFDGTWSIVGSTNLDFQSLRRNEESNVGVLDAGFGKQILQAFNEDLKRSVRIDAVTWASRPFHQKLLEKFFSLVMKKLLS